MITADTSTWINFLRGVDDEQVRGLTDSLREGSLLMSPPVLMELLSFDVLDAAVRKLFSELPRLSLLDGYWERAAATRFTLLKKRLKARSMDCLIAQSCIDANVPLLAHDSDYRHFVKLGLRLR